MTIALALKYSNGILLCSDTEISDWVSKLHAPKIQTFQHLGFRIGIAYAGNTSFAISTMQAIGRKVQSTTKETELIDVIERIADHQYRKKVLSHPAALSDPNLPYWLQVAVCGNGREPMLFETEGVALTQVGYSSAIGIGKSLALYLIGSMATLPMPERTVVQLAAYTLSTVKDNVPNCGGFSHFVALRKDGTEGEFYSRAGVAGAPVMTATEYLERNARSFDARSRTVLFSVTNPDVSDKDFEDGLENFNITARQMRAHFRQNTHVHESFRDLLEGKPKTVSFPEGGLCPPSAKADPSPPPPSLESLGESDGS